MVPVCVCLIPSFRSRSVHLTLAGTARLWHGRMVQILVCLSILHWGFLLVRREETPIPQLREHGDQSVVCTAHLFSFSGLHTEECIRVTEGGWKAGRKMTPIRAEILDLEVRYLVNVYEINCREIWFRRSSPLLDQLWWLVAFHSLSIHPQPVVADGGVLSSQCHKVLAHRELCDCWAFYLI